MKKLFLSLAVYDLITGSIPEFPVAVVRFELVSPHQWSRLVDTSSETTLETAGIWSNKLTAGVMQCSIRNLQFWSPYYRKKRSTRMMLGFEGLSYEEKLDRLGLFSLEQRRLRL